MDKLKELLKGKLGDEYTDDVDQQVENVVEEYTQAQIESETTKLRKNNERLTKQLKEARQEGGKENVSELEDKLDALEQEKARLEKEAEKLRKSYEKDTAKLQEQLQSEQSAVSEMLVDQGIRKSLTEAGVKPTALEYLMPYFKGSARVRAENGSREAVVEARDESGNVQEKPLTEYIKEWSQTDHAKEFMAPAKNSGGGASGSSSGGGDKAITRAQWDAMGHADRAAFSRDGGKVTEEQ